MRLRVLVILIFLTATTNTGFGQSLKLSREPACQTLTPASAGGVMPRSSSIMVVRYLGTSNYEIAFRGKVILLDTFYDGQRGPGARLIGLKGDDVKRADAILIGHPHIDHFADAPAISKRLQTPIFVSLAARPILENAQVPTNLIKYVKGGEEIKMDGFTVMTALARHSNLDPAVAAKYNLAAAAVEPPDKELMEYLKNVVAPYNPAAGDNPDLDIPGHGTIAYVIVFDNGFKLSFRDSPGTVTDGERELMRKLGGKVDVGIIAHQGFGANTVLDVTMALAKLYNPKIFLPAHQDKLFLGITDFSTTPLFMAFREELPNTRGIDPLYRSPICIDTKTDEFYYGQYVK
jgi:L-ascorbate metabolism protein UlaG (beta-lactamase superfamily)